jgi:hypothetical protein
MKKLIAAAFVISAACNAHASDIGGFIGITYVFGANAGAGITLQATSTRREDRAIAAAGVSLYPFGPSPKFGIPVGVGYQGNNAAGIVSYDFLMQGFAISGGYVNTRDDGHNNYIPPARPTVVTAVP